MAIGFSVLFLAVALFASVALGTGTAYLVVRWSKKPVLWALTPVFAFLWLGLGLSPLVMLMWSEGLVTAPVVGPPRVPPPPVVGPAGHRPPRARGRSPAAGRPPFVKAATSPKGGRLGRLGRLGVGRGGLPGGTP
jgi:hypothetical protein